MKPVNHVNKARRILRRALRVALAAITTAAVTFAALWILFPFDKTPLYQIPSGTTWLDRDGIPLRVRLGPGDFDSIPHYEYRADDWIAKAVVAAEDHRFWDHHGVDPLAVLRSCKQTASAMRRVSGASTISMQLIRMSAPHPRTLANKASEAFRALQMEQQLSKTEIISLYLNRAPFGANVIGIEAAARRYFAKGAHDLTLAEAALLAGTPQSPTRLHPIRHPHAAKKRQQYVLEKMLAAQMIHTEQRDNAIAQPMRFPPNRYPFHAPHFCDMLTRQPFATSTAVTSTLDLDLQLTVEESLAIQLPALANAGIHGAAVVIIDVKTGGIRALVGSPHFRGSVKGSQVNAALARRSAGSTLKPFVYAMALDRGTHTPQSILYDVPERFSDYDPVNFDKGHRGVVTLRDALVQSLNLPAIQVEREVGQPAFLTRLRSLRLRTLSKPAADYGLGLVLGNGEVTLLDLTNSYACLARGGIYQPWQTTPHSSINPGPATRIFSEETSWLISDMLGGDERAMDSTGTVADIQLAKFAWKTGTSSGFRDAWTIAYNPDYAIGIWLGNPNGRPSPALVGRKVAAPLVWDISRRLYPHGNGPWFTKPSAIESRELCAISGQAPCPNCPRTIHGHAIRGISRYETCHIHRFSSDAIWPPHVAEHLRHRSNTQSLATNTDLTITSPAAGSAYLYIKDANPHGGQRIPLTATAGDASSKLHWFVNDANLGTTHSGGTIFWNLRPGTHRIVCSDATGTSRSIKIVVREPRSGMVRRE